MSSFGTVQQHALWKHGFDPVCLEYCQVHKCFIFLPLAYISFYLLTLIFLSNHVANSPAFLTILTYANYPQIFIFSTKHIKEQKPTLWQEWLGQHVTWKFLTLGVLNDGHRFRAAVEPPVWGFYRERVVLAPAPGVLAGWLCRARGCRATKELDLEKPFVPPCPRFGWFCGNTWLQGWWLFSNCQ